MPRAGKGARGANKAWKKAGVETSELTTPITRSDAEDEIIRPISAELSDRDIAQHLATSPGFEYRRMSDDDEVTTDGLTSATTEIEADIVPAEVEPPLPMDAFDNATSGEVAPLLRHDSNRHHVVHHHAPHLRPHEQQGLGLEESTPELFLNYAHFVEGAIPEHSTRGGIEKSWSEFKREREEEGVQRQDDGYALFSPLPEESTLPEHSIRGFAGYFQQQQNEQMEVEELPESETSSRQRSASGRTIPLQNKVRGALRAVGKDFTNTFTDMRLQFEDAVEHFMDKVGEKMSLDELSEQNAAQRCLKEGKMAEYHEHQTFASVCAAVSSICRNAVIHESQAPPMVRPRSPLLSATQLQEASLRNLESDDDRDFCEDDEIEQVQDIAQSSNANGDASLGGAAESEVRHAEPVVERVRHTADEIYSQLEQAAEDSVMEIEHMMDIEEARQHVKALEYLAVGNEVSYHLREAASHAAACVSTLLHRAHDHNVSMTSSGNFSQAISEEEDQNENQNENENEAQINQNSALTPKTQTDIPVYPVPPTPTPSPASGYGLISTF